MCWNEFPTPFCSSRDLFRSSRVFFFFSEKIKSSVSFGHSQAAYFELECAHQELADRYQNRESRAEDVSRLAHLEAALADTAQQLERAKKEMAYFKRELINREENFNKKFGAAPNVGVMSVIKPSNKTAPAKPRPMR